MAAQLRLATALSRDVAEGDHLALGDGKPTARIPVTEAVGDEPAVDLRIVRFTPIVEAAHLLAEAGYLRLLATLAAAVEIGRGGRLRLQRKLDPARCEDLVLGIQESAHAPNAEVGRRLIDDLLDSHGVDAHVQRATHHGAEGVHAATAQAGGNPAKEAGAVVEQRRRSDHLVEGKVADALDELRIALGKAPRVALQHPLAQACRGVGELCGIGHGVSSRSRRARHA